MCSEIELVTHRNSNLEDWGESRVVKFLKFDLFTSDFFHGYIL